MLPCKKLQKPDQIKSILFMIYKNALRYQRPKTFCLLVDGMTNRQQCGQTSSLTF